MGALFSSKFDTLLKEGKYEEALAEINRMEEYTPRNSNFFCNKANCLYHLKRYREALLVLHYSLRDNDKNASAFFIKALVLLELKRYDEAQDSIDSSIKFDSKNSELYLCKGKIFLLQLNYIKALDYLSKCLAINQKQEGAHFLRGVCLREMNYSKESIEEFDIEISLYPKCAINHLQKAQTLIKLERYEEAVYELDKALSKNSDTKELVDGLKNFCLIKLNKFDESDFKDDGMLSIQENSISVNLILVRNKAELLLKNKKPDEALNLINFLCDEDEEFIELKARILLDLKREDEAMDYFMKAIKNKEKPSQENLEKIKLIVDKQQKFKIDLDLYVKSINDVENDKIFNFKLPTFKAVGRPVNWRGIFIDLGNIKNQNEFHNEYLCKICFSLVKNPKCCKFCDNLYCSYCLEESLKATNCCPICRKKPFKSFRMNRIMERNYNIIEIDCPQECSRILKMENLEKHLLSECEKSEKMFMCNGCKLNFEDEDKVKQHIESCPIMKVECLLCHQEFLNLKLNEHQYSCDMRSSKCEDCSFSVPLKYNTLHKEYYCKVFRVAKGKNS